MSVMLKTILTTVMLLLSSVVWSQIEHKVELHDSINTATLCDTYDRYAPAKGVFTFRQNLHRAPQCGHLTIDTIKDITVDWSFTTAADTDQTPYGTWFGGTGWTGQPLYVEWSDTMVDMFKKHSNKLTPDFCKREIIVGSLSSEVYFINFNNGKISRPPLKVGNTIKGTISLDPDMNGNLYVGHGIPKRNPFGFSVFNLFTHSQTYAKGRDGGAWRGWGAFDSSPVVVGQFLFWPGENGSLYKFSRVNGRVRPHSTLRYKIAGKSALGIENSMAVYKNYGYFGDNGGSIVCVNLNDMKPKWVYDNKDDIDASIVVDTVGGAYIYVGSEVDKQGLHGFSYIAKLDALTGREIWTHKEQCAKTRFGSTKSLDGGMFASPLLGEGDCKDLIFVSLSVNNEQYGGEIIAFNRATGIISYRTKVNNYLWSSPVGLINSKGKMYIFNADTKGNVFIIEGATGRVVVKKQIGLNFESSPVVVGNSIVMGSRGRNIFKLSVR